jgi:membrane protein DedA with SNARE-associated domain
MSNIVDWAADVIDSVGPIGLAGLVALESIFPPIPSEAVLLLAGVNVGLSKLSWFGALGGATLGSLVGAWVLYAVGALVGEDRMEGLLAFGGKFLGFRRKDIDRANDWFNRHGSWVILLGRLIPGIRSLVSLPAGANKMSLVRFSALTAAGSLVWNSIWIAIGYQLGDRWEEAQKWADVFQYGAVAAVVVGFIWLVVRHRRRVAQGQLV